MVSVYTARQLDDGIAQRAITAAEQAGGAGVELNGGVLGLLAVRRGGQPVQQAPAGYRWPLSTAVMPPEAVGRITSRDVARIVALGQVVMTQTTATLHGVQAGDVLTVLGWDGAAHDLTVGLVAPDDVVGGPELMISPDVAGVVGAGPPVERRAVGLPVAGRDRPAAGGQRPGGHDDPHPAVVGPARPRRPAQLPADQDEVRGVRVQRHRRRSRAGWRPT